MPKHITWNDLVESDKNNIPKKSTSNHNTLKQVTDSSDSVQDDIRELINQLSPNVGPHVPNVVGVYIYQKLGIKGLPIYDDWRKHASDYPGTEKAQEAYASYAGTKHSVDKALILKLIKENSHAATTHTDEQTECLEKSDSEVIEDDLPDDKAKVTRQPIILDKHSLKGKSQELAAEQLEQVYVFDQIALTGQSTALFAPPNTGKTLIALYSLFASIQDGRINAEDTYYIDHDDNHNALVEKLYLFEEVNAHILADGYEGLNANDFTRQLDEICKRDQARGKIFLLDTLKKFVDPMNKRQCSEWGRNVRRFTAKGGTIVALAHTNKNFDNDGWPIFAGVSDLVDDADAAYLMRVACKDETAQTTTVELKNIKRRGDVVDSIAFSFSFDPKISYEERLASVEVVDEDNLAKIKKAESLSTDIELITVTTNCIEEVFTTKMRLRDEISRRTGISNRKAVQLIEKYEGTDPDKHKWFYTMGEHGRKVYSVHAGDTDEK